MKTRIWFAVLALFPCMAAVSGPVRLWQTNLVIPTYLAAPPSAVPRFYEGRTYQGAKATFYPYPVQDVLTDVKSNVTYQALFLENDYLQISVLPELGGRIFSAVDKANGYDFFYRQHVIKPALIGMLGAWISGGVEWNVPHHHRATSFSPVDFTTQTNADGSATIWVGEIELRSRMKWLVGMTLYPDRSYLELTCKVFNRTPFAHPMLFWINAAVHCGPDYQVIFPPSTEWAAQHSKPEFASWPIAHQTYGGTDYTRGVDISWWKNHPNPVSFFCWNYEDDWFGGYDHGKQAGVIHVADHHVAPGKKFFEWGNGPEGEMWSKILTDDDGPYLELMAGAWSDNQPDYSWIQPGETREWKHWWYPVRNMSGMKAANRDLALNLEVTNRTAKIAVNVTREIKGAKVRLELRSSRREEAHSSMNAAGSQSLLTSAATGTGKALLDQTTDLSPTKPFSAFSMIEFEVAPEKLRLSVLDSNGSELASYQPAKPRGTPMPKPVEKPKSPKDYATTDELYFTGQRIEQLYSPSFEARPYYEEILRRDPGDYRANTALGILLCKQWRWDEAAKHLSNAIARATANHIRPKDGEAFYYLGVALRNQIASTEQFEGILKESPTWRTKLEPATQAFEEAAWSSGWRDAACYELAQLACLRGDLAQALVHVDQSLAANRENPLAWNLRAALLRRLEKPTDAQSAARATLAIDPLDLMAHVELALAEKDWFFGLEKFWSAFGADKEIFATLASLFKERPQTRLEVAANYYRAHLWDEAMYVLRSHEGKLDPLTHYHTAFCARFFSDFETPGDERDYAFNSSPDFSFPFQFESVEMLSYITRISTRDAQAPYLLGTLLYDNQPAEAIKAWETARERLPQLEKSWERFKEPKHFERLVPLIHRNLALAYAQHEKNIPKAIASLEKAVELNPNEPRFFYELDVQYEAGGAPVAKRLAMLTNHHAVVTGRDDALTREIVLHTVAGQPERALALLRGRHFRNWEGSSQIHGVYVDACLARGQQLLAEKKPREALREFEAALEYPANLEVGKARRSPRTAQIQFLIGTAHEALGEAAPAKAAFEKAVSGKAGGASEGSYFHALALQKLGRADEAKPLFEALVKAGEEQLAKGEAADYFAKFGEKTSERVRQANAHYLIGLGQLGVSKTAEAKAAFAKALELHPAHLGAGQQDSPIRN